MKLSTLRNLQIGFGLSLLLLIGISITSYISVQTLLKSAALVDHSNLVVKTLENTISTMKDAETGQRGFLLTGNEEFLQPYNGSYQKATGLANQAQKQTADNPQQQKNMQVIKTALLKELNTLQALIEKKQTGKAVDENDLKAGKQSMDALRRAVDKAETDENGLLTARLGRLKQNSFVTGAILVVALSLAIFVAILSYFRVSRDVTAKARLLFALEIKEQETAAANEELAATNEELAAANEELGAANEELNATNSELADAQQDILRLNDELAATNEELAATNEELASSNEEMLATNDELSASHHALEDLTKDLEDRVASRTEELIKSESRFRTIMETMPQIAWTNAADGTVTFFNRQWFIYTGLSEEQSGSGGWAAAIHPDDLGLTAERVQLVLAEQKPAEFELRERRADGVYRWHLVRMAPVFGDDGALLLWVGTATDIQELKQLQQQKDDFISIASHELKTPVTSLKISVQLLDKMAKNPSPDVLAKLVDQANKSLNKVNKLIEDLLDFSKVSMGQIQLNKTPLSIGKLIDDGCQYVRTANVFSIVVQGETDLQVSVDAARIERVLVNLINNAMKYAPESKEIVITVSRQNECAKIAVTDKGRGIAPERIPYLFERYYKAENSTEQYSGLGLGLYISAEIIKKHDGKIGVESKLGEGSTFWFTLPLSSSDVV